MDFLSDPQKTQDYLDKLNASRTDFSATTGIRFTRLTEDTMEAVADITPQSHNPIGTAHGGFLYTFVDTLSGVAAWALSGQPHVTQGSSVSFLHPVRAGRIRGVAKQVKSGRHICIYSVEVYDGEDVMVLYATMTFFRQTSN